MPARMRARALLSGAPATDRGSARGRARPEAQVQLSGKSVPVTANELLPRDIISP